MTQTILENSMSGRFLMKPLIYYGFEIIFELLCSMVEKFVKKFNELY